MPRDTQLYIQICLLPSPQGTLGQEPQSRLGTSCEPASVLNLAGGNLPSLIPPNPCSPETTVTMAGYLERGGHIGEIRNAASDDENLAWVWSKREVERVRKVDLSILSRNQPRILASE